MQMPRAAIFASDRLARENPAASRLGYELFYGMNSFPCRRYFARLIVGKRIELAGTILAYSNVRAVAFHVVQGAGALTAGVNPHGFTT